MQTDVTKQDVAVQTDVVDTTETLAQQDNAFDDTLLQSDQDHDLAGIYTNDVFLMTKILKSLKAFEAL